VKLCWLFVTTGWAKDKARAGLLFRQHRQLPWDDGHCGYRHAVHLPKQEVLLVREPKEGR
jgi:hypothetical protein